MKGNGMKKAEYVLGFWLLKNDLEKKVEHFLCNFQVVSYKA